MEPMELGDLKAEVTQALRQPYLRLDGFGNFKSSRKWKSYVKNAARKSQHGNNVNNAICYEISDEIIDFLRPSVIKGSQRALFQAMLNARPRHNNLWIEMRSPEMDFSGTSFSHRPIVAHWIYSIPRVNQYRNGQTKLVAVKRGEVFCLERFNEITEATRLDSHEGNPRRAGMQPLGAITDAWSRQGKVLNPKGVDRNGRQLASDLLIKNLWFLGSKEIEMSPDLSGILKERWTQGLNNYIQDTEENMRMSIEEKDHIRTYAWVMAILSLMNYDWFVEKPKSVKLKGVKPRKGDIMSYDSHHRVELVLPKTRGHVVVPMQPKRNESYGVRLHEVAGHKRHYRDENGYVYKVVDVKPHKRGNAKLGVITKDYVVTKGEERRSAR